MKKQIIFINRPHRPRMLSQQESIQQFRDDLARLREKYGNGNKEIVQAIIAAEKKLKVNRQNGENYGP